MRLFILAVFTAMLLTSNASLAGIDKEACEQLYRSMANQVDCQLSFSTDARERDDLMKKTYGIIRNITCTTHLNIPKNKVFNALFGADKTTLSPHTIDCDIQTNGDKFKIGLTLAPWIQFGDEGASDVRLNIGKVTGVPKFIGRLIVKYGNGPKLQEEAKKVLNQFLAQMEKKMRQ